MTETQLRLPRRPCITCPYSRRTPPGVWNEDEYAKLPLYDGETFEQPHQVFQCHYDLGDVCAGWLACHDRGESLALRLGVMQGTISEEVWHWEPADDVQVFESGAAAAEHGTTPDISDDAAAAIGKIKRHHGWE